MSVHFNQDHIVVFIVSAPSGVGKTTITRRLQDEGLVSLLVSVTTRAPREGEVPGENYYFVSRDDFLNMVHEGKFMEWEEVYGECYGTTIAEFDEKIEAAEAGGPVPLLEIDIKGKQHIKKLMPNAASVFIAPPSYEALRERLIKRQQNTEDDLENRMHSAEEEMRHQDEFDHVIVNSDIEDAIEEFRQIIKSRVR